MGWRKTLRQISWVPGLPTLALTMLSACNFKDCAYKEPCLWKESWSYDDGPKGYCTDLRKKCWNPSDPFWYDWEECRWYRDRYPEDNPNPNADVDAGVDDGGENPDGGENGGANGGNGGGASGGNGGGGAGANGGGGAGGSASMDAGADAMPAHGDRPDHGNGYSCIPRAPDNFFDPQPVYFGPANAVIKVCPYELGAYGGFYTFDPREPEKGCPKCTCDTPEGDCYAAPESLYLRDGSCNQLASAEMDISPPVDWDGSCSSDPGVNLGSWCSMSGNSPCVHSIHAGKLAAPEQHCKVVEIPTPLASEGDAFWAQAALSCNGEENKEINHAAWEICIPSAPEWRSCIRANTFGLRDCDSNPNYTDLFIMYPEDALTDKRTCSPCECSTIGGTCTGELTIYGENSCMDPVVSIAVDSSETHCQDIPPGTQMLGAKQLTKLEYIPGTCDAQGGAPTGGIEVDETYAQAWCCLRLDYVRPPLKD